MEISVTLTVNEQKKQNLILIEVENIKEKK